MYTYITTTDKAEVNFDSEKIVSENNDTISETFVFGDADADNSVSASDSAYVLQKALVSKFELPAEKNK